MQTEETFGSIGDFKLTINLGSGTFSEVYKATIDFIHFYACKFSILNQLNQLFDEEMLINSLKNESRILLNIDTHPNICKAYFEEAKEGVLIYANNLTQRPVIYSILEYIHCEKLSDYIGYENPFSEKMGRFIFMNIINGLKYLHEQNYVHRDIKTDNIVLDKNYNPKLIDFGLSSTISENGNIKRFTIRAGTESYMAPEVLISKPSYEGPPVDIFAAGVTLFRIIMGFPPFRIATLMKDPHYTYIANNEIEKLWKMYPQTKHIQKATKDLKNLIISLLAYHPSERLTFDKILNHDWMKGAIPNHEEIFQKFSLRELKILELKRKKCEESKVAYYKGSMEEQKNDQNLEQRNNLGAGNLIKMEGKVVRRYDRPYGFITAQQLYFEDQFILQFIIDYVFQRLGKYHIHDKYMSVSVDMNHDNGELVKFNAEVMRDDKINVLVFDKIEGDKLDFYLIYHGIIDSMIKAYS